jgi:hypothetical protein
LIGDDTARSAGWQRFDQSEHALREGFRPLFEFAFRHAANRNSKSGNLKAENHS